MDRKELKKANGDIYFEAEREANNSYIHVSWIGIQSLETLMYGANHLALMLQKRPCNSILNNNKELIGPWEDGALYLGNIWAPKAKHLGLKYFAQVLAPGIYGQRSFIKFREIAEKHFQIEAFADEAEAKMWLLND